MKKTIYTVLAVVAMVFAGCEEVQETTKTGLQLKITTDGSFVDKVVKSDVSVDINSFVVDIVKKDGKSSLSLTYAELPDLLELSPGEYTVNVYSPTEKPVAWELPVFGGTKDFTIVNNTVTPVDMVCTLQNMKNSVYCSQHFIDQITTFDVKILSEDGTIVWTKDEVGIYTETDGVKTIVREPSRHAYFSVKELNVTVSGYRELDGTTATLSYAIKDVAARDHHILYVDAYVTGQSTFAFSIDASVSDKNVDVILPGIDPDDSNIDDDIEVGWGEVEDGGDQPSVPDVSSAPYVEWPLNPDFEKMNIEDGMSVELMVYAPAKIKSFIVKVSDNFLPVIHMLIPEVEYLDLINDQATKDQLGSMLPVGDQLLGQTEVAFSLSGLVPFIADVGKQGQDYVFTLEVTDEKDQTLVKPIEFYNPVTE